MEGMARRTSLIGIAVGLAVAPVWGAPFTYTEPGGALLDYDAETETPGVVSFLINVTETGTLTGGTGNVVLRLLGFEHTWAGDLEVMLTHEPTGVSRTAFSRVGAPADPDNSDFGDNYSFSSSFSWDLWAAAANLGDADVIPGDSVLPPRGYYPTNAGSSLPNDFSAAFAGLKPAGAWRLTITDFSAEDTGSLLGWELTLDIEAARIPEPSTAWLVLPILMGMAWVRRSQRR